MLKILPLLIFLGGLVFYFDLVFRWKRIAVFSTQLSTMHFHFYKECPMSII